MKNLFLSIMLISTICLSAQQPDKYTQAMINNLSRIDSAITIDQKRELSNSFERIAQAEKDQWQPYYYAAMLQVLQTYQMKGNEVKNIDETLDKVEQLLIAAEIISPYNSEILCMQSMAASARIIIDPMSRGTTYGKKAMDYLNDAIKSNPENPRAHLLMGQTLFYTPSFIGGGKDKAKPYLEKSVELFKSSKPEKNIDPNWGMDMAQTLMENFNK